MLVLIKTVMGKRISIYFTTGDGKNDVLVRLHVDIDFTEEFWLLLQHALDSSCKWWNILILGNNPCVWHCPTLTSEHTLTLKVLNFWKFTSYCSLKPLWSGMGGSSAGSYLADPTSPIPSHCVSIVATSTVRVNFITGSKQALSAHAWHAPWSRPGWPCAITIWTTEDIKPIEICACLIYNYIMRPLCVHIQSHYSTSCRLYWSFIHLYCTALMMLNITAPHKDQPCPCLIMENAHTKKCQNGAFWFLLMTCWHNKLHCRTLMKLIINQTHHD